MKINVQENNFEMDLNIPTLASMEIIGNLFESFCKLANSSVDANTAEDAGKEPSSNEGELREEKAKHFSDLAKKYQTTPSAKFVREEKYYSEDFVKTLVDCPVCNAHYETNLNKHFKGIRCRQCDSNLFLGWATGVRGELDEDGNYFIANSEFVSRKKIDENDEFESMFNTDEYPNSENTIAEITSYLDENGINHKGITLKGKLLELAKKSKNVQGD